MQKQILVTVGGEDRPGIVKEITEGIVKHSANVEESSTASLGGQFVGLFLVSPPSKTVNQLLGDDTTIAPEDVRLLDNGWVQLKRGANNLYISPHAVESVLVEDGELP